MSTGRLYRAAEIGAGIVGGILAVGGTAGVVIGGFALSFNAIKTVAIAAHITADLAWLMPVTIDGSMAVATVVALVIKRIKGQTPWYPWGVVAVGVLVSVACNGLHARMVGSLKLEPGYAVAVSAIPAVNLALSVHLLVMLAELVTHRPAPAAVDVLDDVDQAAPSEWLAGTPEQMWAEFGEPIREPVQVPAIQPAPPVPLPVSVSPVHTPEPVPVHPVPVDQPAISTPPARTRAVARTDTPAPRIEVPRPVPVEPVSVARIKSDDAELLPLVQPVVRKLTKEAGGTPGVHKVRAALALLDPPVNIGPTRAERLRDLALLDPDNDPDNDPTAELAEEKTA